MKLAVLATFTALFVADAAQAQDQFDAVEITTQELAPGVAVLYGVGGNMAVSYGEDGTILIDDQFAPLTPKIEAAVDALGADPVHYVINTHWHTDHTGGNEHFGKRGAHIFAHENVRSRLNSDQILSGEHVTASPKEALPVVTFERGITMHQNGDTIDILFLGGGHTDGDSIVRWRKKNIVHMGDLFLKISVWPYIDLDAGGDIEDLLFSLDSAVSMMDSATKVIPGHGSMSDRAELIAHRNVVGEAVTIIRALKNSGIDRDDAIALRPLDDLAGGEGARDADRFIRVVWGTID